MNGYKNSKNDEELIKMLEEMQDELDSKDNTITDLERQLQTSANSSTVSMLKSKIQEQADEIVVVLQIKRCSVLHFIWSRFRYGRMSLDRLFGGISSFCFM